MKNFAIHWKTGLAAGLLFFLHALIPNSHAWPMIWPGIGAIALVIWLKKSEEMVDYKKAAKRLLQAGLISSAIFFVGTILMLATMSLPQMSSAASFLGAEGPLLFNATAIFGLLVVAAIGIIWMLVIGSLTYLAFPKKTV